MNEQDLIKNCINKSPMAQKALFNAFYDQMFNIGMRFLSNRHDTEDILIFSFTKVFDKIGQFEYRGPGSLKKWVKTIVINEAIRFLKQKKELHLVENYLDYDQEHLEETPLSIDADKAYEIIESMPAGYRTIFNLYAVEGYSHQEISEMLQIAQSTSKSQLCRARTYIIEKLKKINQYGKNSRIG